MLRIRQKSSCVDPAESESGKPNHVPLVRRHSLTLLGMKSSTERYSTISIMRLSTSLLLPLYAGAATAITDAKVYIFPDNGWSNAANPPALSPEETRLVFAQRLGVSQYHSLDGAADDTLSYINRFGGRQMGLFETVDDDKAAELVLFVEGASAKNAGPFLDAWSSIQPAFTISNPPSSSENLELVFQMDRQLGSTSQDCPFEEAINPGNRRCWKGKSKIIQIDLADEASGYYVYGVCALLTV